MIKRRFKFLLAVSVFAFMFAGSALADEVQSLLDYYVSEFKPEKALLIIQYKPDETGGRL